MIKIKSFNLDKADEASDFLIDHTPLTTDKQSGIAYTVSHIMVMYDDGVFNYKNIVNKFKNLIGKERENIALNTHELARNKFNLKKRVPKKYKSGLSTEEILKLCAEQDGVELTQGRINYLVTLGNADEQKQKKEYGSLTGAEIKISQLVNEIISIENNTLMAVENIRHSQDEIQLYEETIRGYEDAKK